MTFKTEEKTVSLKSGKAAQEAFTAVYDRYFDPIYKFIYYKTYRRETAEDLTSQTFLKAYEKYSTYVPERGSVGAWLYQIARNTVIDYFRKKTKTISINDVWDLSGRDDIETDLENREKLEKVRQSLSRLPVQQRDIIILRIWQDLPYREIAAIMGKSEGSCKMLFCRTVALLKESVSAAVLLVLCTTGAFFN